MKPSLAGTEALPRPTRSDAEIADRAESVLAWNATIPIGAVRVWVLRGWVTLSGTVTWEYQRRAAEKAVGFVDGVTGITNRIAVKRQVTPQAIKSSACVSQRRQGGCRRRCQPVARRNSLRDPRRVRVRKTAMIDLSTTYLGFTLPHPLMPGASPLADDLDMVRRLEDAGAAAIVMRSLFQEQITRADLDGDDSSQEVSSTLPPPEDFALAPDCYLEQVQRIKAAVGVPVIASINGTKRGGWLRYARQIEEAGADALESELLPRAHR